MIKLNYVSQDKIYDEDWIREHLRNQICKFCYDICNSFNWSKETIENYCYENSISYQNVRSLELKYRNNNFTDKQKQQFNEYRGDCMVKNNHEKLKQNPVSNYAKLYNKLLSAEAEEQVEQFIEESGINPFNLRRHLFDYITVYCNGSNEIEHILSNKIDLYMKSLSEQEKEKRRIEKELQYKDYVDKNIDDARLMITNFIEGNYYSINDYCLKYNIKKEKFDEYLKLIEENDIELYNKYSAKQEFKRNQRYAKLCEKNKKIVELIKNGIEEDGKIREFDLLDYYNNTKSSLNDFMTSLNGLLTTEEYRIIKTFISKNQNDKGLTPFNINQLYNTKTVVGVNFDEKGKIIEGSGREITKEEKQNIISYLNSRQIPITKITYNIAFRRWLSGNLNIEEKQEEKRK